MTRHNYSSKLKDKVIKEALETGNCALVARRHEIAEYTVRDWVRAHKTTKNSKNSSDKDTANNSSGTNAASLEQLSESQENERLKKIIGEKDLEIAILKDLLKKNEPTLTAQDVATTISSSLLRRKLYKQVEKLIIRTDNGPQFISRAFGEFCAAHNLEHERIPVKTPNKNAHIESFNSILEDECLSRYVFQSYEEAYKIVSEFIKHYNRNRIHSSIRYLTPEECYKASLKGTMVFKAVRL